MTSRSAAWVVAVAGVVLAACRAGDPPLPVAPVRAPLATANKMAINSLTRTKMAINSRTRDGLLKNRLVLASLSDNDAVREAITDTTVDPESGLTQGAITVDFLTYLYGCAMPAGATLELTFNGTTY